MTDLTDRMRTCAAFLLSCDLLGDLEARHDTVEHAAVKDAANLLIEASNVLEESGIGTVVMDDATARHLGIIPPGDRIMTPADRGQVIPEHKTQSTWIAPGGPLPYAQGLADAQARNPRACPKCDSRGAKTVHRTANKVMLICPVCGEQWEWKRDGAG